MANTTEKISQKEQDAFASCKEIFVQYNSYPLPTDVESRKDEFAERLKSQMEKQKMTKAKLARESGASATTITNLINGSYDRVSVVHIYLFAAILHCSPHYLAGLVDGPGEVCAPDGTRGFVPIIFWSEHEKALIESFKKAAREDKVFADYMYQIVKGGPDKMEKVKEVLEQMEIVEPREPDRVEYEKYLF